MNKQRRFQQIWLTISIILLLLLPGCLFGGNKAAVSAVTATPAKAGGLIVATKAPQAEMKASPTAEAEKEKEATPTEEPAPTATLMSTATPEAPAATPEAPTATAAPTNTPADVVVPSGDVYEPIPGCAKSRLHWGDVIRVVADVKYVRIRSSNDTRPSDNIVRKLYRTELAQTTGLPSCNYGWIVWPIRTADGTVGWVPESNGIDFWFDKVDGAYFPTPTQPSR